jgi:23S rRNA pseudouridine955/2504/2580 synthase
MSRSEGDPPPETSGVRDGKAHGAKTLLIDDSADGQRIDNFLLKTLSRVPKSRVYRMLRSGEVRVNGGRKKPTYRLCAGDAVRIPPHHADPAPAEKFIGDRTLAELEASILFEDQDLLVVNKTAGLAVHGGSGVPFGLIEAMRRLRGPEIELVHRLDRDTSGCLLLAKHRSALTRLHQALRDGTARKHYRLIVQGAWPEGLDSVRLALHKYQTESGEGRVRVAGDGKPSRTDFTVLDRAADATLLEAHLLTGRTHQIRVHAASSGHAIVGDSKYSAEADFAAASRLGIRRLCLHAQSLSIPWEDGQRRFECPVPDDFADAWQLLKTPTV